MQTTNQVIGGRYELVEPLGSGSQGETFIAVGPDGERVVVKKFTLAAMEAWKSLELFQREIETLRSVDHPRIPRFVDAIEEDDAHYLVQEHIEGEPLSDLVARGAFDEKELRAVARDVLEVLTYLHGLVPPVVHRDLKPSNIVRRPDGTHIVVDFGGVQNIVAKDTGGSTVIGTTGYMPSEQLIGRAVPQSDIYALGATLAHLATARHPAELPTKRLVLEWRPHTKLEGSFADFIDRMLEPAPEDRPDAVELQNQLRGQETNLPAVAQPRSGGALVPRGDAMPFDMRQRVRERDGSLVVDLSPDFHHGSMIALFAAAFVGFLIAMKIGGALPVVLALFGGVGFAVVLSNLFQVSERLIVHADGTFEHRWSDGKQRRRGDGRLSGAIGVTSTSLQLATDSGPLDAASGLDEEQRAWVADKLSDWMRSKGQPVVTTDLVKAEISAPIESRVSILGSRLTLSFPTQDRTTIAAARVAALVGAVVAGGGHLFGHGLLTALGLGGFGFGIVILIIALFPASRKLTAYENRFAVLDFYDPRTRSDRQQRGYLRLDGGRVLLDVEGSAPQIVDPSMTPEESAWFMRRVESLSKH